MRFLALGFFLTTENGFGGVLSIRRSVFLKPSSWDLVMPTYVDRGLPTAHLTAIGRAIAYFSGLDVTLDVAISRLLNVKSGAHAAITVGFGTESKVDLLESLAETTLAHGPARKEILALASRIRSAIADRNFIAHAHWLDGGGAKIDGYLGKRNKTGYRQESWDAEKIEGIAREFNRIEGDLLEWYFRKTLKRKHVSWHDRRLPPAQQSRPQDLRALYSATRRLPPRPSGA